MDAIFAGKDLTPNASWTPTPECTQMRDPTFAKCAAWVSGEIQTN
jgi:hypothetical protein